MRHLDEEIFSCIKHHRHDYLAKPMNEILQVNKIMGRRSRGRAKPFMRTYKNSVKYNEHILQ